ncbi:MAG: 2-amino-4-hydroxy-6-hydroxymethyldihydropteridine diphosphokinase, partial [Planctomycetaceae bacterium]
MSRDVSHTARIRALVALGGNLGPVTQTLLRAVDELGSLPETSLGRASPHFEFPAVGEQAGGVFRNAACELFTAIPPKTLLHELQRLETRHGRTRDVRRGPRTLDLDLILYGDAILESAELTVPHPACWYRRFVLDPLVEIAPDAVHPVKRATFQTLRNRLMLRPLPVGLCGATPEARADIVRRLRAEFPAVEWLPNWRLPDDPALLLWLGAPTEWDSLPAPPRLAVPGTDPLPFLRDVLTAALGG